jgi:hypothetical protein
MILHISFTVFSYTKDAIMRRRMRYLLPLIVVAITAASVYSAEPVNPYRDYPAGDSAYGICTRDMNPQEAEIVIQKYFTSKGLRVVNLRHINRFIEVDIYRNGQLYDKILFDRKTGRIRSIN